MAEEIIKVKVDLDVTEFSKNAKAMSDALSKVLGKEIELFNGRINKTTKLVEGTEKALGGAANAANKAGNSIKQSNQQWTNFALVIQDLPFGFRAIQNNLPAIIGGFAGMAGPIYLAGSAIIAFFTAWDKGVFGAKKNLDILKESQNSYLDSLKTAGGSSGEEMAKIKALTSIAQDSNVAMFERLQAVKELQKEYPNYFGNLSQEKILNGDVADAVTSVKDAIIARAQATAIASQINTLSSQKFLLEERLYQLALIKTKKIQEALAFVNKAKAAGFTESAKNLQGLIDSQIKSIREEESIIKGSVNNINKELERLGKGYEDATKKSLGLETFKDTGAKPKVEDNSIALLKSQQQYYKDNILMFAAFEQEILRREEELAVKQAKLEGKSAQYIKNIRARFAQDRINSAQEVSDKLSAIQAKLGEEEGKELEAEAELVAKGRKMINDGLLAINQKFLTDDIDSLSKANDVKQKLDKGNLRRRIQDFKEYIAKLEALRVSAIESGTGVDVSPIDKAIKNAQSAMLALGTAWDETSRKINSSIQDALVGSFMLLGETIGNALAGKNFDAISALGGILATALTEIGKALIQFAVMEGIALQLFKDPTMWPVALAAGIAAVAAGAYLKSKMGGSSGGGSGGGGLDYGNRNSNATGNFMPGRPNFGLLNQYPNTKTGENMSGLTNAQDSSNNSATFVLKGQDLLLSVNRAQKASQLKGQNINLAG